MAYTSKKRARSYLVGDLDCIFNEHLVHSNFLTPAAVAEEYEKLTEKDLKTVLTFIEEDLFDLVEAEFSEDFLVNRGVQNIGFIRLRSGKVVPPSNFEKDLQQDHQFKEEEPFSTKKSGNRLVDEAASDFPKANTESIKESKSEAKDEIGNFDNRYLEQSSSAIPGQPPTSQYKNVPSRAKEELPNVSVGGEVENKRLLSPPAQKLRLFKQKLNIYPKPVSKPETFFSSDRDGVAQQSSDNRGAKELSTLGKASSDVPEVMPCPLGDLSGFSTPVEKSSQLNWYDEFGLADFDLDEEFGPTSMSSAGFSSKSDGAATDHQLAMRNSSLTDWDNMNEALDAVEHTQYYWVENDRVQNYDRTFVQRSRQCAETMELLELSTITPHWLASTSNVGTVFDSLFKLNDCYPEGCTANQLAQFEKSLSLSVTHFGLKSSLPCFASLYDCGLLTISGGLYFVAADVLAKFIFLRRNLCSNTYRLLRANSGVVAMQSLVYMKDLSPPNIPIDVQDIVSLCNRFPLLFSLILSKEDDCVLTFFY